jgi:hypothetical protein
VSTGTQIPGGPASALPRVTALPAASGTSGGRGVGAFAAALCRGALLGGIAIVLGWALTESTDVASSSTMLGVAVYVAMLGAVYGLVSSAWGDAAERLWGRALERAATGAWVGLVGGGIAGAVAFVLYDNLQSVTDDPSGLKFYLLRVLAWAIFGAGIGAAPGVAERAGRKVANGMLGGLIGGAAGGAIFHWASFEVAAERDARLLGLTAIGVGIGAATAVVELARRRAWLRVTAGGMAGKEFPLYHHETDIGSSPKAQITLIKDALAAPLHARIVDSGDRRTIRSTGGSLLVNGQAVRDRRLRNGDRIQIGATTLTYAEILADA